MRLSQLARITSLSLLLATCKGEEITTGGEEPQTQYSYETHPDVNTSFETKNLDPTLVDFLNHPFDTFNDEKIHPGFKIILLSNLAEGCTNRYVQKDLSYEETEKCLERVVEIAIDEKISPYHKGNPLFTKNLGEQGTYLGHLNMILGAYYRVTRNEKYKLLNEKITLHLQKRILEEKTRHMHSYPSITEKWPADHAAILYSLWIYDNNFGTDISEKPILEWLEYMNTYGTDKKTGLHIAEITGGSKNGSYPRGCALSWTIGYMSAFAPEEATRLWERYKENFSVIPHTTLQGFREWPRGVSLPADADSGPIIGETGVSATVFSIRASKGVGDTAAYTYLNTVISTGTTFIQFLPLFADNETIQYYLGKDTISNTLSTAILFNANSTCNCWF